MLPNMFVSAKSYYSFPNIPDSNKISKGIFKVTLFVIKRKLPLFFEIKFSSLKRLTLIAVCNRLFKQSLPMQNQV
jgi:hypothetical protein